MKKLFTCLCLIGGLLLAVPAGAQHTETLYLSGKGLGDTKTWEFYCSSGHNSGRWSTIEVPSQWELQGFGEYTFGRFYLDPAAKPSDETGLYRYTFDVPADWKGKQVDIVFEGVMTDTEVSVNGHKAGTRHQGGFYTFCYDITDKVRFDRANQLEVKVWKESANKSVNAAERRADFWIFGGIYRPVYLKAVPRTHIERIAVDARTDGQLTTRLHTRGVKAGMSASLTLTPVGGGTGLPAQTVALTGDDTQTLTTRWTGIRPWDCEHPNLYTLRIALLDRKGQTVHVHEERIGFRTIEFRPKDGLYVNGTKVVVKGINRHCFHPDGGRTTNRAISLHDAELIKEMNMNAVRSHYPPDRHFLDACDSLGLFYLEELTGWHGRYDATVGDKLLREMIANDVNHPCILLWSNGNEGGWNKALDARFAEYDPQGRHVVHPWADFNGLDTHHYPAYQTGTARLANGYKVFMPTEFLHGQYDRGLGAGLEDFWSNYRSNPLFAGGFLWTFLDEAVKRSDRNGQLDSDGPNGPDGIVGPYREKEGSFYTVREVWAPIQFKPLAITPSFNGEFFVTNDYLFTNLRECRMVYRLYATPSPLNGGERSLLAEGTVQLPAIDPGETGKARMKVPATLGQGDILQLEAYGRDGKSICTWTWPVKYAAEYFAAQRPQPTTGRAAEVRRQGDRVILAAERISATFNAHDGTLLEVRRGDSIVPFNNGPIAVGMKMEYLKSQARQDGTDAVFTVRYRGAVDSIVWRLTPDGLLGMEALMLNRTNGGGFKGAFYDPKIHYLGLSFDFPENEVKAMRWLGRGPYRVWKNRIKGTNYGIWEKEYNNTVTGESFDHLVYPEFKGYHGNLYWATLQGKRDWFTVYSETDGLYLRVFTPEEPQHRRDGKDTMPHFPEGDLSFLYDIPAIQSFKPISEHGPKSQPSSIRIKSGDEGLRMKLWFDFR